MDNILVLWARPGTMIVNSKVLQHLEAADLTLNKEKRIFQKQVKTFWSDGGQVNPDPAKVKATQEVPANTQECQKRPQISRHGESVG